MLKQVLVILLAIVSAVLLLAVIVFLFARVI